MPWYDKYKNTVDNTSINTFVPPSLDEYNRLNPRTNLNIIPAQFKPIIPFPTNYQQEQHDKYKERRDRIEAEKMRTTSDPNSRFNRWSENVASPVLEGMMYAEGAGTLLKYAGKTIARQLAKLPLENVPILNQTYKLNPLAFKPTPNNFYRSIGDEGYRDAIESGVIRAKQTSTQVPEGALDLRKSFNRPFFAPSEKFEVINSYNPSYIAEVPENAANFVPRYNKRNDWSYMTKETEIPIDNVNLYKKNWLQGYKQVR